MSLNPIHTKDNSNTEELRISRFQKKSEDEETQRKQNTKDEFISHDNQIDKKLIKITNSPNTSLLVSFNGSADDTHVPIDPKTTTKTESKTKENNPKNNIEELQKLLEDRLGLGDKRTQEFIDNWDKDLAKAFDEYNTEDGDVSEEDIERLQKLGEQVYENSKGNDAIKNQAGNDEAIMDRLTKDLLHEKMLLMKEKTWINYWNANNQGIKASAKLAASLSA
jgi:hypothetical protein